MGRLDDPAPLARIPFYEESWAPKGLDLAEPAARSSACRRCQLARQAKNVCMAGGGKGGAPLVVGSSPTHHDDLSGQMIPQGSNQFLMQEVARHVKHARYAWAVSCAAGRDPEDEEVEACQAYLAWEFDLKPERAVLLGPVATRAVFGFPFNPLRLRRGRGWARGVPCFFVAHPQHAHNKFVKNFIKQDLEWALTAPIESRPDGVVEVLDAAGAISWLKQVALAPLCFDFEYWPKNIWLKDFQVLCLSLCQDPERPVVLPAAVLKDPAVREALKLVMEDVRIPKVNQDIKNDRHVMWRALGIETAGVEWDTLIASRLRDADAPSRLDYTEWQVGFGGHKGVGQAGAEDDE